MRATCRGTNNDLQLDLFTFDRARLAYDQITNAIRPNGRASLEKVPAEDGRGTGSQGAPPGHAAGGLGTDRSGDGPDLPPVETRGPETATSPRPGLGDGLPALHFPPAGAIIHGHDPVIHPNGHHAANHETGSPLPVPQSLTPSRSATRRIIGSPLTIAWAAGRSNKSAATTSPPSSCSSALRSRGARRPSKKRVC